VSRPIMFAAREPAAVAIFLFPTIISTLMNRFTQPRNSMKSFTIRRFSHGGAELLTHNLGDGVLYFLAWTSNHQPNPSKGVCLSSSCNERQTAWA
jgi:hypothetical protein